MYQTATGINSAAQTVGYATQAMVQDAQPPQSILHSHLSHVHHLQDQVKAAINRVHAMADVLLGAEPSPIGKPEGNTLKGEPPLTTRITDGLDGLHSLLDELHIQLNRLERL